MKAILIIAIIFLFLVIIVGFCSPHFLTNYFYPFFVSLTPLLLAYFAYSNYDVQQPKVNVNLMISNEKSDLAKKHFSDIKTKYLLIITVENIGRKTVSPIAIKSDKDNQTIFLFTDLDKNRTRRIHENSFSYMLKEGETYVNGVGLNNNQIKMIEGSNKIYLEDISKRKYFISKKILKEMKSHIIKYS